MQRHLCGQAHLQPAEGMGPFPIQAEGMLELVMDRFPNLADAREPAPHRLGPRPLTVPFERADDLGPVGRLPRRMVRLALKALVDDIGTPRGRPDTRQARMGLAAQGKKGVGQPVILRASRPTATAGDHAGRVHRQQPRDAFIPAQPVAPADIRQAGQPARTPARGIAGRHPGAVEGFIGTALSGQELDEIQKKRHQGRVLMAALPIVLLPGGQRRKGGPEMALGIAIKTPRTAKALLLPEQG